VQQLGILKINGCRRVEQFRDAAGTRSGSAGLGFQKSNLRRRFLVIIMTVQGCQPALYSKPSSSSTAASALT
jgi:hypothetical protein